MPEAGSVHALRLLESAELTEVTDQSIRKLKSEANRHLFEEVVVNCGGGVVTRFERGGKYDFAK